MYEYAFPKGLSMLKQLLSDSFVSCFMLCDSEFVQLVVVSMAVLDSYHHKHISDGVKCELFHNKMADGSTSDRMPEPRGKKTIKSPCNNECA